MRLVSLIIAQLFNGLQTGSIFALVALGYSMVYGIIMLLNFAHGDIIMIGAYTTFYAMTTFHLHPVFSLVLAVCVSTVLGVVIEKVAYTPLRSAPRLSLLITAIGISFLLENGAQLLFGADTKSMDVIVPGSVDRLSRWNSFHVYAVPIAVSPYINTLGEEKECLVLLAGDIYTGM